MIITIKCKNCSKEFDDYESNHKKFCCKKCLNEYQKGKPGNRKKNGIYKKCLVCGNEFYVPKWRFKKNPRYCSKKCSDDFKRGKMITSIMKKCKICKKEFKVTKSSLSNKRGKCCSKKCDAQWKSISMKGGKTSKETIGKMIESRKRYYDKKGRITSDMKKYGINYRKDNKDKVYENHRKRRARKNNAKGSHTYDEWLLLKKQYGYKCPCCGKIEPEIELTEDHIVPLSKGGSDYIENIQPLCKSCNCKKHTKIIKY